MSSLPPLVQSKARLLTSYHLATRQNVILIAALMVLTQLAFRSWAIYGGWFYGDDLKFLSEAATTPLSLDFLFTRHQQQLMPGGLLIAWLVGQGPAFSWSLAASTILLMQAVASVSCVIMLTRLFGTRLLTIFPLMLYLFAPLTLGAFMWWAAALNQLPFQIVFFWMIIAHVEYLRTRRVLYLAASNVLLVLGLLFYIKSVLVLPVLLIVSVAYFTEGSVRTRARLTLLRWWPAWSSYGTLALGYLVFYTQTGESPVAADRSVPYLETADRQIRETLGPALLGGPWRWLDSGRQDVLTNAPDFAVTIAWSVLAAIVGLTVVRRRGAWQAWLLLVLYLVPTVFLTANGRASMFGPDVGLYVRYVTDVAVVACLSLGCSTMRIRGSNIQVQPRSTSRTSIQIWAASGATLFMVGSVWSTVTYVNFWHEVSPVERYISQASYELRPLKQVEIIDEPVPDYFVLAPNAPFDRPSKILAPFATTIAPVTGGTDLEIFNPAGELQPAVVTPGISSRAIDDEGCGTPIRSSPKTIRLTGVVTDETWWLSIPYLSSGSGVLTVEAGQNMKSFLLEEGPHTLFYKTSGSFDEVTLTVETPQLAVCAVEISVGFIGAIK